jgi:hypothetical protein
MAARVGVGSRRSAASCLFNSLGGCARVAAPPPSSAIAANNFRRGPNDSDHEVVAACHSSGMSEVGQKRPKLRRLPVAKSATPGMGKIVPETVIAWSSEPSGISTAGQRSQHLITGLYVTEDQIEVGERCVVLGICPSRKSVGHHDDLEIEHHGVSRCNVGAIVPKLLAA